MRKGGRGEITKISKLFSVYAYRFIAPEKTVLNTLKEILEDMFGIPISISFFSYSPSTKTISIKNNGPLKSEVLMNKKEILNHLKGRLGEKNTPTEIV